jgi:predicted MPP superfamily phosphohydrolase
VREIDDQTIEALEARLGRAHVRRRLAIESDRVAHTMAARHGRKLFHLEHSRVAKALIFGFLEISGLMQRGARNAAAVEVRTNGVRIAALPAELDGFTLLQISDLHIDRSLGAVARLAQLLPDLSYDVCVLTGDYRGDVRGTHDVAIEGIAKLRPLIKSPVYGILGNHDGLMLLPRLEALGIRVLMNETVVIERGAERLFIAGIDDANFYGTEDLGRAAGSIPRPGVSVLLSHTPEVYREAEAAGFALMLCGHTHGGQICLPGGVAVMTASTAPRWTVRGAWRYQTLQGYTSAGLGTSLVTARFNCPPEITLHRLERAS